MPLPNFPSDLEKAAVQAVEKSTKVEFELTQGLTKLKTEYGKIDPAAFKLPKKVATEQVLQGFEAKLDGEKDKIKTLGKAITEVTKAAAVKDAQLKKEKAKPAAIQHVEKIIHAAGVFGKAMTELSEEADDLLDKARLLLETAGDEDEEDEEEEEGPRKADPFLLNGLKTLKSADGLFALAVGSTGAYLVAGPRIAPALLKHASTATGGGKFLRGDCAWSQEKNAYVFGLANKPPAGLAKKIRKAILDQSLNKLIVKVLVRGPDGQMLDADTDADAMGELDLEDAPEISAPTGPGSESVIFSTRLRAIHPAYVRAIQLVKDSKRGLDALSKEATDARDAGDWDLALEKLGEYEDTIKETLAEAAQRAQAGPGGQQQSQQPKPVSNVVFQQSRLLWDGTRKKVLAELQAAETKLIAHCKAVNDDPNSTVEYDIPDVEAKAKELYTVVKTLDESLKETLDDAPNAATPAARAAKQLEAKAIMEKYETFVDRNQILTAMQASRVAQSNIRETILGVLGGMKSKL